MDIRLDKNAYGKNAINLSRIIRHPDRHEIRHISVDISLSGDFEDVHTAGDNTKVLPTDTMKNTVYALAKDHFTASIEAFGLFLADYLLSNNPQVTEVRTRLTEYSWTRMTFNGTPHPHSFVNGGSEKHVALITRNRQATILSAGINDLLILKTTDSGFENYIKDKYTTLKETSDRIFSTECDITWIYENLPANPDHLYAAIREDLLQTFSNHKSLSVQHTLYAMGANVLKDFPEVKEITLKMPNKHHILFNLQQFGMDNNNEVFIATDEPYGYITGTLTRN
ncbi:urate oxidase [Flavitalea sp. BT771]|uniref:factor-independent urate hydroxylase n=1 Tax=Flavitalea sp. BT771 TaxID=3063329 RepID=UPI0026E3BD32|nr:urate oxidase [Flavitalea sp. BT771]MDO6431899.1 urate oxidase [Flavitalea sp. BT771]MDV6220808.1 urate oxidase [Flavitalea sp. BT771]